MGTAYQLVLNKEWDELENFCKRQSSSGLILPQTPAGDTLFHLAVFSKSKEPLVSLLKISEMDPTAKSVYSAKNIYGSTALHEAAADGNIEAIHLLVAHDEKILEDRNKEDETPPLLEVTNNEGETPLFKAAAYGKTQVVKLLAPKSRTNGELKNIHREKKTPKTSILHAAIRGENFETAFELLKLDESLATAVDGNGMTSLELLATMPSAFRSAYRMSIWKSLLYFCPLLRDERKHNLACELCLTLIEKDTTWVQIVQKILIDSGESKLSKPIALFLAAERGILEIVKEILKQTPQLAEYIDDKKRNMLHIAIMHRQKEIFDLVKEMNTPMKKLEQGIDKYGYTILHHAGNMTSDNADIHRGPAYHLQEELKWYKRVEELVPTHYAMLRVTAKEKKDENKEEEKDDNKEEEKDDNKDKEEKKYNCEELFKMRHKELLKDAQKWVKQTSQSCFAVAVLAATVLFTAVYNVPGGSNDKGYPILLNNDLFIFYTVMVIVAFVSSMSSVVMFLLVFTSPVTYEEFHHRLPRKLEIAFTLLFVSLGSTMLAFVAGFLLVIRSQTPRWIATFIYIAAFLPVSIFAFTQFPIYFSFKVTLFKFHKWIKKALSRKRSKKLLGTFLPVTQFRMYVAFKATLLKFYKWIKKAPHSKCFKKKLSTNDESYCGV